MEKEIAEVLLEIKAVELRPKEPFRWASGILSPIYCDNRLLLSYPEERKKVVDAFEKKAREIGLGNFDVVAGVESSGIPHGAWLAERLSKPMAYIRKKKKEHGKENLVEGKLEKGQKVLVVEDLISTGGSLFNCVEGVREQGGIVENCLAIFSYELEKSKLGAEQANVKLHPLTNFSSLVETAKEKNFISEEDMQPALDWKADPQGWGKKMGFE